MTPLDLWERYRQYLCTCPSIGLQLDISRMDFDESFLERMAEPMDRALTAMEKLEQGDIANVDEGRRVGHYWLRAPSLAPTAEIKTAIEATVESIKRFVHDIHSGAVKPQRGDGFDLVLLVGIGGSVLGPQFVSDALGTAEDPMVIRFVDNTDPDGIDRLCAELDDTLQNTLTIVISKSGTTIETRNAQLELAAAYQRKGLEFSQHAVAVTCEGSALHKQADREEWLRTFFLWDWVGGRTSEMSAVGLLPAALQGVDVDSLLAGARACDNVTRQRDFLKNPASLLALMWHYAGHGRGERNMVVLPYRDRLSLFGRYLQQLVMESIGKERDRTGRVVHQGLTVFGHKGSTDQHAYIQQLRDGTNDFFVMLIRVLRDREGVSTVRHDEATTGDYLNAFSHGTRDALYDKGRESVTLTLDELNAYSVGVLIALFERTVGLYAELIDVNAYHQPGVEAGKKAAQSLLVLQKKILRHLREGAGQPQTARRIATALNEPHAVEAIHHILEHISANPDHGIRRKAGSRPWDAEYIAEDHS